MKHTVKHEPSIPNGYQVCECGATRKLEDWKPIEHWHACNNCAFMSWHEQENTK